MLPKKSVFIIPGFRHKPTSKASKGKTKTFRYIPSVEKYLIQIQKTDHDIGNTRYLQTLRLATKELL